MVIDNVDRSDFEEGSVILVEKDEHERIGCPAEMAGAGEGVDEKDGVVFRYIEKVIEESTGDITIVTRFISGMEVVPFVRFFIDSPDDNREVLKTSVRDSVGLSKTFSDELKLFQNATTLAYELTIEAGACVIDYWRFNPLKPWKFDPFIKWNQKLGASADVTLTIAEEWEAEKEGRLTTIAVPGAGISINAGPVGKVIIGLVTNLDWVADISVGSSVTVGFEAGFEASHEVTLTKDDFTTKDIGDATKKVSKLKGMEFGSSVKATAGAKGFFGLRPSFGATLQFPKVNVGVDIGASVGIQAEVTLKTPPFPAATGGGATIGDCASCHSFQGDLSLIGKDLGIKGKFNDREEEEVFVEALFTVELGKYCGLKAVCPASGPISGPTPVTSPPGGIPPATPSTSTPSLVTSRPPIATPIATPKTCSTEGKSGACISTADCGAAKNTSVPGLCPGPANIQCCVADFGRCTADGASGKCISTKACTSQSVPGLCPGPANIQCCVDNYGSCTSGSKTGKCIPKETCKHKSVAGLCPGPADIQCCVNLVPSTVI